MKKLLQNKITGSRLTLPVTLCYAIGIWLLGGLIQEQWWIQFGCFMLTAYLMVQLNNTNALIRIYSRMVSVSFLLLSCMACFLFPSLSGNFTQLCIVASYLILFQSYHDKSGAGLTYYGFLCIGLASLTFVHILYFVPFLWILMLTCLQSFSLRTFFASLMGIFTPYWLGICWLVYQDNFSLFVDHLTPLVEFQTPFDFSILNNSQKITFAFVILLALIGAIHYWRTYYLDKFLYLDRFPDSCFHLSATTILRSVNQNPDYQHSTANWAFHGADPHQDNQYRILSYLHHYLITHRL